MHRETVSIVRDTIGADDSLTPVERDFWTHTLDNPSSWRRPRILKASEVAKALGTSVQTVRFYARLGLLRSVNPTGKRSVGYTEESVQSLLSGETRVGSEATRGDRAIYADICLRKAVTALEAGNLSEALSQSQEAQKALASGGER